VAQEVAGSSPVVRPMEVPRSRVAESGLLTIDLEALLPIAPTKGFDLANHLEGGLILREKPFRAALEEHRLVRVSGHAGGYLLLG
jgi:hypothetical protein